METLISVDSVDESVVYKVKSKESFYKCKPMFLYNTLGTG